MIWSWRDFRVTFSSASLSLNWALLSRNDGPCLYPFFCYTCSCTRISLIEYLAPKCFSIWMRTTESKADLSNFKYSYLLISWIQIQLPQMPTSWFSSPLPSFLVNVSPLIVRLEYRYTSTQSLTRYMDLSLVREWWWSIPARPDSFSTMAAVASESNFGPIASNSSSSSSYFSSSLCRSCTALSCSLISS